MLNVVLVEPSETFPDVVAKAYEDISHVAVAAVSLKLQEEVTTPFSVLKYLMYPECLLHNMDFNILKDEEKFDFGESI